MNTVQVLDTIGRVSPLGCRLYDPVMNQIVHEGMEVTAYSLRTPWKRHPAIATRSGAFGFRELAGLGALEFGRGDDEYWQSILSPEKVIVEVIDRQDRFLPFSFEIKVPTRGLVVSICEETASPPDNPIGIDLHSAPTRPVMSRTAVLRAQLWDATEDVPAAWARVEVMHMGTVLGRGLADDRGGLAIVFPYPDLVGFSLGSPLLTDQPFHQQSWSLELRAYYHLWKPVPKIPDRCQVLGQPPAQLWAGISPLSALGSVSLDFGKELIVRSTARSELLISTVGSLP